MTPRLRCVPANQAPSEKGSTLKGKPEFKFFPFRVDPFSKGDKYNLTELPISLKTYTNL